MNAKLNYFESVVEECDGAGEVAENGNKVDFDEIANHVIAADFGMKSADEASDDDVKNFLVRNNHKVIEVDPDYFC